MSVIYSPKGKAGEYAKLALNIYNGCSHGCTFCFAPALMRKSREDFLTVSPRKDLLTKLETDLKRGSVKGNDGEDISLADYPIHLCFTCDPYPRGEDTMLTREVIKRIKGFGYNVQILTKAGLDSTRDLCLLGKDDWYGFSFGGYSTREYEPNADSPENRILAGEIAIQNGLKTWVSCEPVLVPDEVESFLKTHGNRYDLVKIGKPNYMEIPNAPDWVEWGKRIMEVCNEYGVNAVLKDSLKGE